MGRFIQETRNLARANNCAILFLHHIRKPRPKPGDNVDQKLQATPTLEWLREAAGARALINQTTTRIAFDLPLRGFKGNDAALVMKYFVKVTGDSEPVYLERVFNDDGEPVGYRPMVGVELLGDDEHQKEAFNRLPLRFSFKEAKHIYDRADDPTKKFLRKCEAASLVRQVGRGAYERIDGKKG